jgi:predicted nucleotidyltransferase
MNIDLPPRQRQTLLAMVGQFLPDTQVWAFGSRISGTSRPWSDLDIVVFPDAGDKRQVSDLREALDESGLPFRVDVLDWGTLPESFRENIKQNYAVLR